MGANKLLISVVDDDAAIRKALRRLLSSADMNVATFDSGQAFLDSLANQSPDCLILDLHMPGISGLELLQGLSRIDVAVPTIVITAYDERAMECLAAGAQAYLRKPVDDQVLLSAIESAIRTHTVRALSERSIRDTNIAKPISFRLNSSAYSSSTSTAPLQPCPSRPRFLEVALLLV